MVTVYHGILQNIARKKKLLMKEMSSSEVELV